MNDNHVTTGKPIDNDVQGRVDPTPDLDRVYDSYVFGKALNCHAHYFNGQVSDFRFWDTPISRDDIFCVFADSK